MSNNNPSLRLILDVRYLPHGVDAAELKRLLEGMVMRGIGNGGLTEHTEAEVDEYTVKVIELPAELAEDELADFMAQRIESGNLALEDIPMRLARYGLMEPGQFVAEMRERMGLDDGPESEDVGDIASYPEASEITPILRAHWARVANTDGKTFEQMGGELAAKLPPVTTSAANRGFAIVQKLVELGVLEEDRLDPAPDTPVIKFSKDGGLTFQVAPEGVRIVYERVMVPGEDGRGELHLNCTHEGMISDVWVTREEPLDHNIGTASRQLEDILSGLVEDND